MASPVLALSWKSLLALDQKADGFPQLANQLLAETGPHRPEDLELADDEAFRLIELIDTAVLRHSEIPGHLKAVAFVLLRRLSGRFRRLPLSCLVNGDFWTEEKPFVTSRYTDIWKQRRGESYVAVKALRLPPGDVRHGAVKLQRLFKEVPLWKQLNHPNVLPFYGVSTGYQGRLYLVSSWMENGNILQYAWKNPEANRLQLLAGVADGLEYLHRLRIVHGNIRESNILICCDKSPRALLGDVGLDATMSSILSSARSPVNATKPQPLPPNGPLEPSLADDIHAFAMTTYGVLTGQGITELVGSTIHNCGRPPRPTNSMNLGFTNGVWALLEGCWLNDSASRPSVGVIAAGLREAVETWVVDVPAFMFASEAGVKRVMNLRGEEAQDFANRIDEVLDRIGTNTHSGKTYLEYLQRLCSVSGLLPASFMLTDGFDHVEEQPLMSSRLVDVYKGTYKGQSVTVTSLKATSVNDAEKVRKGVVRWKWLQHANILPFVGITSVPLPFSIVSTWMPNGNIGSFLRANEDHNPFSLLVDATKGLQYLHDNGLAHGTLKGANILVDSECRARLADFGLGVITEGASSDDSGLGSVAWMMAPEILDPDKYGYTKQCRVELLSRSADIYALGMTILEVVTRRRPFEHINPESAVIQEVLSGNRPCRPALWLSSRLWTLMTKMWLEEYKSSPPARPNVSVVLKQLQDEAKYWSLAGGLLAPLQRGAGSGSSIVDLERFDPEGIIRFLQGGSLDSQLPDPTSPSKSERRFMQRAHAQKYADMLDTSLDDGTLSNRTRALQLRYLRRLCGLFGILPSSFILADTCILGNTSDGGDPMPFAKGGCGCVYQAAFRGRRVAVKTLFITNGAEDQQKMHRLLAREVVGWKWLQHENILPFVGVTRYLAIVSDLMENGNIMEFIAINPHHNRLQLLVGAASGLEYLHDHNIVHGDLKGVNILIDSKHSARLADFGLTTIIGESTVGTASAGHPQGGTTRWMAPEMMYPELFKFPDDCRKQLPSKGTDIYSLGMTILEVLTRKHPFSNLKMPAHVMLRVMEGVKPDRPLSGFSDALWNILLEAWDPEYGSQPPKRPSVRIIMNQMEEDAEDWDQIVAGLLGNPECEEAEPTSPQPPDIIAMPKAPTTTSRDGQRTSGPRGVTGKPKRPHGLNRRILESLKTLRVRGRK